MIISKRLNQDSMCAIYEVRINEQDAIKLGKSIETEIAELVARKYVHDNYGLIAANLNPVAIANIAIANAGVKINETLQKVLPDSVHQKTAVYEKVDWQKGVIDSLNRVY